MDYEWEVEHENLEETNFQELQRIICEKIVNIIIKLESEICTI